jgi:hypothetical protein
MPDKKLKAAPGAIIAAVVITYLVIKVNDTKLSDQVIRAENNKEEGKTESEEKIGEKKS